MEVIEERINNDREIISSKLKTIESEYFDLPEKKMEYERLKYMEDLNNQYFTYSHKRKLNMNCPKQVILRQIGYLQLPSYPKNQ